MSSIPNPIVVPMTVAVNDVTLPMSVSTDYKLPISLQTLEAGANGEYTAPKGTAWNEAHIDVSNSYTTADEGKVVSGGALVAQTGRTVTQNNTTYDTTTNSSLTVEVAGPSGSVTLTKNKSTYDVEQYAEAVVDVDPDEWVRPSDWPDLDSITMPSYDCIYLTYDLRKTPGLAWIGVYVVTAGNVKWTMERGTLDSAGNFTAETSAEMANYSTYRQPLDSADGDVQLFRVTAVGGANITECFLRTLSDTTASNLRNDFQPCVERRGQAHFGNINPNGGFGPTQNAFVPEWMERDRLEFRGTAASVSAYSQKKNLKSLDFSGSNLTTYFPHLVALQNLREILFSSGSKLTNGYNFLSGLYAKKRLDLRGLDTSATTNANLFLNNCACVEINVGGLDLTSVTTPSNFINSPLLLETLIATGMTISDAVTVGINGCTTLTELYPWVLLEKSLDFGVCFMLSKDSLLRIIDALPNTTQSVTLTLGQNNTLKLTASEIAVATEKGWTVA